MLLDVALLKSVVCAALKRTRDPMQQLDQRPSPKTRAVACLHLVPCMSQHVPFHVPVTLEGPATLRAELGTINGHA